MYYFYSKKCIKLPRKIGRKKRKEKEKQAIKLVQKLGQGKSSEGMLQRSSELKDANGNLNLEHREAIQLGQRRMPRRDAKVQMCI